MFSRATQRCHFSSPHTCESFEHSVADDFDSETRFTPGEFYRVVYRVLLLLLLLLLLLMMMMMMMLLLFALYKMIVGFRFGARSAFDESGRSRDPLVRLGVLPFSNSI